MAKQKTLESERRFVPFVGWKGLLARPDGRLCSPSRETDWPPRQALVAECDRATPFARCTLRHLRDHDLRGPEGELVQLGRHV